VPFAMAKAYCSWARHLPLGAGRAVLEGSWGVGERDPPGLPGIPDPMGREAGNAGEGAAEAAGIGADKECAIEER
jgi:hypothetical protein